MRKNEEVCEIMAYCVSCETSTLLVNSNFSLFMALVVHPLHVTICGHIVDVLAPTLKHLASLHSGVSGGSIWRAAVTFGGNFPSNSMQRMHHLVSGINFLIHLSSLIRKSPVLSPLFKHTTSSLSYITPPLSLLAQTYLFHKFFPS